MQLERFAQGLSWKGGASLLLTCAAALLCFSQVAEAQSGRGKKKPAPLPQTPLAAPPPGAPPQTHARISSLVVTGDLVHPYKYMRSSYVGDTLNELVEMLKARDGLEVTKGGSLKMTAAADRAKKETDAYVLWMGFVTADAGYEMTIQQINYVLLAPRTAEVVATGRIDPRQTAGVNHGDVVGLPLGRGRIPASEQMKYGARAIVRKLIDDEWL